MSSFTNKKALKFVITLGTGSFGSSANNQITLQGFRAIVSIDRGGGELGERNEANRNSSGTRYRGDRSARAGELSVHRLHGADVNDAVRFSREQDAGTMLDHKFFQDHETKSAEHIWQ
jgi:hypothetical protein